jgi:serine/threonine protein kinase/WD40 repeat protein
MPITSDGSSPEERRAPPGEASPSSSPTVPPGERTGPYQPPPAEGLPEVPGYEILGELGRGGMGVVYQARQVGLDRLVALKVVLAGTGAGPDDLARFRREAEAIARLRHPNVVEIYEVGDQGGVPHFAMELCGGGSLAQQLAGGPLAPRRAAELVETLARAVQAAHEAGVVHRDLKPANVLLAADGTPKITDFGLAKKLDGTTELTATGVIVGTASYMAPEQASGDSKRVGPGADVYALGAVLYACLTGRPPFCAGTQVDTLLQVVADPPVPPSQLRPGVPADLEAICLRCLEKKPGRRFASAAELADALQRFLEGLPAQVRPRDDRLRDNRPRRPVGCTTAVLGSLAGALLLVFGLSFRSARSAAREDPLAHGFGEVKPVWVLGGSRPLLAPGKEWGQVYDIRTGRVTTGLPGKVSYSALAFAHGSDLLAMGSVAGTVQVQDVCHEETEVRHYPASQPQPSRKTAADVPAHDAPIQALAFSRDDRTLATASADEVRRWDVATGRILSRVPVRGVLSPDGQVVLGRSAAGSLELLDTATGKRRADLDNPGGPADLLRFSPDGRLLAAATRGGAVWLWDLDGPLEKCVLEGAGGEVRAVVFSSDGAVLAVATDQQVTVWDTGTRQPRAQLPGGPFEPIAVTPAGDRLFLQTQPAARLRLVELPSGKVLHEAEGHTFFALAPAGDQVLTLDGRHAVHSWDAAAFGVTPRPAGRVFWILLAVFSMFGTAIVVASLIAFRAQNNGRPTYLLAFSADGNTLASASGVNLMLWDVAGERLRGKLELPTAPRSVSPGLFARLLDEAAAFENSRRRILALGFTPDGRTLVTLDNCSNGCLWNVAEGRPEASFQLPTWVKAAAFGPDGRTLATVGKSSARLTLTLWDVDLTGRVSRRVEVPVPRPRPGGEFPVFVADGHRLAVLSRAGLRLWDIVPDGLRERPVPESVGTDVGARALSPDGRMAAFYVVGTEAGPLPVVLTFGFAFHVLGNKYGITRITFWDLAADRACSELFRQRWSLTHPHRRPTGLPSALTFAPDGRMVAGFGEKDPGRLWDPLTGRPLGNLQREEKAKTTAMAFSPDGRTLAVGDEAGGVTWLDVDAGIRAGRKAAQDTSTPQEWRGALAQLASRIRETPGEVAQGGVRQPSRQEPSDPDNPPKPDPPIVPRTSASPETRPTVPSAKDHEEDKLLLPPRSVLASPSVPAYPEVPGYEVLEELGRGGMGVVYKARQVGLDRLVALKLLPGGAHAGADELARFHREAEAIARLHHPNVVGIYEVGDYAGRPYFSMELCAGGSLAQRLARGPLPAHEAALLTAALAWGVHAAHNAGVIHRDLKPANVLLAFSGRSESGAPSAPLSERPLNEVVPKITDFGLAKKLDDTTGLTATGVVLGTPSYMAPEQASGQAKQVGPAADVYALGAVLYACLTGRPPFQAATPLDTILQVLADPPVPLSQLRQHIPAALEAICLKCLEKEPHRRYPSAAALAADLERFLTGGLRGQKRPRQDLERLWRFLGRRPRMLRRAACTLLALAVPCLIIGYAIPQRTPRAEFPAAARARLSPDSSRLLVLGARKASLYDTFTGEQLAAYEAPTGFTAVAISPDGGTLALGEAGGETQVWDLPSHTSRGRFHAHDGPIHALAFRPDGRLVIGRGKAGTPAGEVEAICCGEPGRPGPVLAVTGLLSPDGRWLVEDAAEGLRLWDTVAGQRRTTLPVKPEPGLLLAFSPDGATLATAPPKGTVQLWDTATGNERARPSFQAGFLLFSADGHLLLAGWNLWAVDTGQQRAWPDSWRYRYHPLAFTPDGRSLVARRINFGKTSLALGLLDLSTGQERATVDNGRLQKRAEQMDPFGFVAVSADGRTLLTGHRPEDGTGPPDGRLRVWDWEPYWQGKPVVAGLRQIGWVTLVLGLGFGVLGGVVWVAAGLRGRRRVLALAFPPDGRALAVGRADGALRLLDLSSEEVRVLVAGGYRPDSPVGPPFKQRVPAVRALAFRKREEGEDLAVVDGAGVVNLWDLATLQKPESVLTVGRVTTAAFSPDGRWLACAVGGRPRTWRLLRLVGRPAPTHRVWLWDLAAGRKEISVNTDARFFSAMTVAPSGSAFAALTETGLRLYRLEADGRLAEQTLAGAEVHPQAVPAFTPDGGSLVVRRRDGVLQAWEVATGRCLDPVRGPRKGLALVYAPDGRSAVTVNADGTASLWDLAAGQEQAVLEMDAPPNVTVSAPAKAGPEDLLQQGVRRAAFSPDGRTLALADGAGSVAWCDVAEVRRTAGCPPKRKFQPDQPG